MNKPNTEKLFIRSHPLIIGVMGGATVSQMVVDDAYQLGKLIASEGWILLNGGRPVGVMDASAKGAKDAGGITIGILPDDHAQNMSSYIDIPIVTGLGIARNCINILSSHVIVACPGGAGTLSEIALALKSNRPVILLNWHIGNAFSRYESKGELIHVTKPENAIDWIKNHNKE